MQIKCSLSTHWAFSTVCPDPVTIHQSSCHALPYCMPTDSLTVSLNFSCLYTLSTLTQQCMMSHNRHIDCTHCRQLHLARSSLLICIAYMHCLYALLLHQQQLLANALHVCMYGAQLQLQSNTCGQVLAMSRLMLLQAMVKDHKLNSMLLPASKLKQMLRSHSMYSQNPAARCGFRVPNKRLW